MQDYFKDIAEALSKRAGAVGNGAGTVPEQERQEEKKEAPQATMSADELRNLSYRLNICNMYMLNNLCRVAGINPPMQTKYDRHNSKSYMDMKKKHICMDAMRERLANQREIVRCIGKCDADKARYAVEDLELHLRADGYKFK